MSPTASVDLMNDDCTAEKNSCRMVIEQTRRRRSMLSSSPPSQPRSSEDRNRIDMLSMSKIVVVALLAVSVQSPHFTMMTMGFCILPERIAFQRGHSFMSPSASSCRRSSATTTITRALPENYQLYGEETIRKAALTSCGIDSDESLKIEWKPGKIIVTVCSDDAFVSIDDEDDGVVDADGVDEEQERDDDVVDDEDDDDDGEDVVTSENEFVNNDSRKSRGVDVTVLARAINKAFDDGGIGFLIAESHEIEVTTPGAPDELSGIMWESYRGFEVICQQLDLKTKKVKTIEGRLVERNGEFTIINIKGRMKKMKNDTVLSVKLPKPKKEKGVS